MTSVLKTALRLLKQGFWPVPLRELGESYSLVGEERISKGKEPISPQWGLQKPSEAFLKAAYDKRPKGGLGIRLGPMGGLVDVEIDGMGVGDETLSQLMGGDVPETIGWDSRRGPHRLFAWDDRCMLLDNRGKPRNVIHFSGLEIRFGTDAQLQSACPPTLSEDGKPRTWHKTKTLATLPDIFFENLDDWLRKIERRRIAVTIPRLVPSGEVEKRAVAYLEKCPPAVSGANGHTTTIVTAIKVGPGFDLPEETAFRLLRDYYSPRCDPPWTEKEVWHKVEDAYENPDRGWLLNTERERPTTTRGSITSLSSRNGSVTESSTSVEGKLKGYRIRTFEDVDKAIGDIIHLWENWIVCGNINMLFSKQKVGKSRFYLSLVKSLWFGTAWPDETENPWPPGIKTIIVPYDSNSGEINRDLKKWGVPLKAAIYPSDPDDPKGLSILDLQSPKMADVLEFICENEPNVKLLIVDTLTYASARNLCKPEDVKVLTDPLMRIAEKYKIAPLLLVHESGGGQAYGLHIGGRARIHIRLERYSEDDWKKVRLYVKETNFPERPALTMFHESDGIRFGPDEGPVPKEGAPRGRPAGRGEAFAAWLKAQLETGPCSIHKLIELARDEDLMKCPSDRDPEPSISPLYNARERLVKMGHVIDEILEPSERGKPRKTWVLAGEGKGKPEGADPPLEAF